MQLWQAERLLKWKAKRENAVKKTKTKQTLMDLYRMFTAVTHTVKVLTQCCAVGVEVDNRVAFSRI